MDGFKIPDMRFEQTFFKQLNTYAGNKTVPPPDPKSKAIATLTDEELKLINKDLDDEEIEVRDAEALQPLAPITPGIVVYAILKDQVLMPLLQGFLWAGLLISIRPVLGAVVRHGQRTGVWIADLVGLNRIRR